MVFIMPYEELVIEVMDKVIQLANSQVSRKMWYQVKNVCPKNPKYNGKRGRHTYNPIMRAVIVNVLRELGFKVIKKEWSRGRMYRHYFLIDLDELMNS